MNLIRFGEHKLFNADLTHTVEFESIQGGLQARIYIKPTQGTDVQLCRNDFNKVEQLWKEFSSRYEKTDSLRWLSDQAAERGLVS